VALHRLSLKAAAAIALMAAGPAPAAQATDDPPWVKDWTVLLPAFSTAIGACIDAARGKPGWAETHWVLRAAPMNRGLGLVALEASDGTVVECAADLATGKIQRFDPVDNAQWDKAGGKALYVVPPPRRNGSCGTPKAVTESKAWIGWIVDTDC